MIIRNNTLKLIDPVKPSVGTFPFLQQADSIKTNNTPKEGPSYLYKQKTLDGILKTNHRQAPVLNALQDVYMNIKYYSPGKFTLKSPRGLYIYGPVGTGKTMLMDLFYQSVPSVSKRRSHFNDFMADVHSKIHRIKLRKSHSPWGERYKSSDPIKPLAKQLVKEAWLLCFDEFQVTDVADAMILKRLFTSMFENGMVMVATSNRAPDDLYKNGLQRSNFIPFIGVMKKYCNVISLSGRDYRMTSSGSIQNRYLISGDMGSRALMEEAFKDLCTYEKQQPKPKTLVVLGHTLTFNNACGSVLYASFKDLCEKPLGVADYLEIAKNFHTILIRDIPRMNLSSRNQAKRFILLIDTLYDNRVRLMLSAEARPQNLFSSIEGRPITVDHRRSLMDDLNIQKGSENAKANIFTGSEEVFAFDRAVSRINEMCSTSYWSRY